jgi:predicted HD superfamily hydrolase involved in NAD metabolism
MMNFLELVDVVKKHLDDERRFDHILNVVNVAEQLANHYGENINDAKIAALLHDITKHDSDEFHQTYIASYFSNNELNEWPKPLWHALSAVAYSVRDLGISDANILNAIQYHTSGRPNMSLLEKIIYVADYIEPSRRFDNKSVYDLAFINLDKAVASIMKSTLTYLEERHATIFKLTQEAYLYYQSKWEE